MMLSGTPASGIRAQIWGSSGTPGNLNAQVTRPELGCWGARKLRLKQGLIRLTTSGCLRNAHLAEGASEYGSTRAAGVLGSFAAVIIPNRPCSVPRSYRTRGLAKACTILSVMNKLITSGWRDSLDRLRIALLALLPAPACRRL